MLPALLVSVPLFVATNLDDLFILLAFFAHPRMRAREVVAGQYLGIGALFLASLALAVGARLLPEAWIGLLGLLPIALGVRELAGKAGDEDEPAEKGSGARSAGNALSVAGVTIANGGDNLGAWVPVFASRDPAGLVVIAAAFALLTGLLCFASLRLVRHPELGAPIRRHAGRALPWVLIAIGLWILYEADSLSLLSGVAPAGPA